LPPVRSERPGWAKKENPAPGGVSSGRKVRSVGLNRSDADVLLLVIGDRTQDDEVGYPDIDMHSRMGPDGRYRFSRKDGSDFD
jgi:uncharacterized cupin superfamily protein